MKVRYTPRAKQHLDNIAIYLLQRDRQAAARVGSALRATVGMLKEFPRLGRRGGVVGTLELKVPHLPLIVVYHLAARPRALLILGVYHCAQDR